MTKKITLFLLMAFIFVMIFSIAQKPLLKPFYVYMRDLMDFKNAEPSDNQFLAYNSVSELWVPKSEVTHRIGCLAVSDMSYVKTLFLTVDADGPKSMRIRDVFYDLPIVDISGSWSAGTVVIKVENDTLLYPTPPYGYFDLWGNYTTAETMIISGSLNNDGVYTLREDAKHSGLITTIPTTDALTGGEKEQYIYIYPNTYNTGQDNTIGGEVIMIDNLQYVVPPDHVFLAGRVSYVLTTGNDRGLIGEADAYNGAITKPQMCFGTGDSPGVETGEIADIPGVFTEGKFINVDILGTYEVYMPTMLFGVEVEIDPITRDIVDDVRVEFTIGGYVCEDYRQLKVLIVDGDIEQSEVSFCDWDGTDFDDAYVVPLDSVYIAGTISYRTDASSAKITLGESLTDNGDIEKEILICGNLDSKAEVQDIYGIFGYSPVTFAGASGRYISAVCSSFGMRDLTYIYGVQVPFSSRGPILQFSNDQTSLDETDIYLAISSGNCTIDWGDGNDTEATGASSTKYSHDYTSAGTGTYNIVIYGWTKNITDFRCYTEPISGDIAQFGTLTNLTLLWLSSTSIGGDIASLSGLTALEYLYLSRTSVDGGVAGLSGLTSLIDLYLSRTSVDGDIANLSGLTLLEYLVLSDTSVSGDITSLSGLISLIELYLDTTSVSGDIANLSGLTLLEYLVFYDTSVDGDIANLSGLTSLLDLTFNDTSVSGDIADLSGLVSLTWLYLYNTSIDTYTQGTLPDWEGADIQIQDLGLDQTEVSNFLIDLDNATGAPGNGTLDISGTNAIPNALGLTAKGNLEGKSWSITVSTSPVPVVTTEEEDGKKQ